MLFSSHSCLFSNTPDPNTSQEESVPEDATQAQAQTLVVLPQDATPGQTFVLVPQDATQAQTLVQTTATNQREEGMDCGRAPVTVVHGQSTRYGGLEGVVPEVEPKK
jgi:hypothetical protein